MVSRLNRPAKPFKKAAAMDKCRDHLISLDEPLAWLTAFLYGPWPLLQ